MFDKLNLCWFTLHDRYESVRTVRITIINENFLLKMRSFYKTM